MAQPTWVAYSFAVVMMVVSLYCIAWLIEARRRSRQNHVDVNAAHVAMGLAMAGMLVPRFNPVPDGVWEAVFVAIALWFSWHGLRVVTRHGTDRPGGPAHGVSHYLIHLVMALAMLYMYLAAVPSGRASGPTVAMTGPTGTTANFVGLPLLFVVVLLASAVWQLDGLSRYAPGRATLVDSVVASTDGTLARAATPSTTATTRREPPRPLEPQATDGQWLAPRLEMCCHIAMCVTMGYMLTLML